MKLYQGSINWSERSECTALRRCRQNVVPIINVLTLLKEGVTEYIHFKSLGENQSISIFVYSGAELDLTVLN
jgi:hypothetical protein